MKKYFFLLTLGLALSFSGLHAQDWLAFQADNCLCKLQFPAKPELEQEQKEGYKSHRAMVEYEGIVYLFDYGVHPEPIGQEDSKMIAGTSVDAFSTSLEARVLKQKKWKVNGWEGFRTTMEVPAEDFQISYNTIMIRSIHYQIATIGQGEPNKKMVKKFLKSFKLI